MLYPLLFAAVYLSPLHAPPPPLLLGRGRLTTSPPRGTSSALAPSSLSPPSPTPTHLCRRSSSQPGGISRDTSSAAPALSSAWSPPPLSSASTASQKTLTTTAVAAVTVLLTATYPIWFAQSTLAHADIFAAAFTLWALSFYLDTNGSTQSKLWAAVLFSLSALSKETAVVTPLRPRTMGSHSLPPGIASPNNAAPKHSWLIAFVSPILPLAAWYAYHKHRTGYIFGNPEFLRYNATANLGAYRILLSLWHRFLHLATHMNMFVPIICMIAAMLIPVAPENHRQPINRPSLKAIGVILLANWIAFSILGGALLTRYLLPMYPLILLVCVNTWRRRIPQRWLLIAALSFAAFLSALWINPPYAFAPEDNLTYRDMIVLHQQAVRFIDIKFPRSHRPHRLAPTTPSSPVPNSATPTTPSKPPPSRTFPSEEIQKAAADPGSYDTALIFSTKWEPPANRLNLSRSHENTDAKYFDFHRDVSPAEAAALLHGDIVWQARHKGEWAAVLHFPRIVEASLTR